VGASAFIVQRFLFMIDTHCHLTDPRLASQLDGVLDRAARAGVGRMITIGTDLDDSQACVEVCAGRENVRCAVGVHPTSADANTFSAERLAELMLQPSVVAIGEIGLDYFWVKDSEQQAVQKKIFSEQLRVAEQGRKPVVIHCREAVTDCLAIMKDFPRVSAVYHCFTGTLGEAKLILNAGYWLGFTGAVTFKRNDELREVAKSIPADRMLIETDAPYMTPEPMRKQKTNEPAMLVHTARMIAEVRGVGLAELKTVTDENARRFFGW
jgi:TatD DNase family protein